MRAIRWIGNISLLLATTMAAGVVIADLRHRANVVEEVRERHQLKLDDRAIAGPLPPAPWNAITKGNA
jgi:hypothetical protein